MARITEMPDERRYFIRARLSYGYDGYELTIGFRNTHPGTQTITVFEPPTLKEVAPGTDLEPTLHLSTSAMQQLIDSLWQLGFRPKEQQYTSEHIQALNNHLDDMRVIVATKLNVNLKVLHEKGGVVN